MISACMIANSDSEVWLNVGHICICRLINKKTNSTFFARSRNYEITRLRDYEITSDLECVWPESENNGTPGPDLFLSRDHISHQEEHTDNVSVAPSVTWTVGAFARHASMAFVEFA
jgi:hypothetical protein